VTPGATVIVKNLGANQEIRVKTSESGSNNVLSLEPVSCKRQGGGGRLQEVEGG
jgi:hypothetical protein